MMSTLIGAKEVAETLEVSEGYAYKLIRKLNSELKDKGFITISGKIDKEYFYSKIYGLANQEKDCYFYEEEFMCAEDVLARLADDGIIFLFWNEEKQCYKVVK